MSVKAMAWVWDQKIERDQKFILLAYADHADHDGKNIFPAVASVANKTGYSERSIQRITQKLISNGWLVEDGKSAYQTNKYSIPIYGGDKMSPPTDGGIESEEKRGDILSGGDTDVTGGVTKTTGGGDIAMSPEPSLTINKPKREGTPYQLAKAISCVCIVDFESNKGRLLKEAKLLKNAMPPPTPGLLQKHYSKKGWWYKHDWRGKRGELPTPSTIRETWARACTNFKTEEEERWNE